MTHELVEFLIDDRADGMRRAGCRAFVGGEQKTVWSDWLTPAQADDLLASLIASARDFGGVDLPAATETAQ